MVWDEEDWLIIDNALNMVAKSLRRIDWAEKTERATPVSGVAFNQIAVFQLPECGREKALRDDFVVREDSL